MFSEICAHFLKLPKSFNFLEETGGYSYEPLRTRQYSKTQEISGFFALSWTAQNYRKLVRAVLLSERSAVRIRPGTSHKARNTNVFGYYGLFFCAFSNWLLVSSNETEMTAGFFLFLSFSWPHKTLFASKIIRHFLLTTISRIIYFLLTKSPVLLTLEFPSILKLFQLTKAIYSFICWDQLSSVVENFRKGSKTLIIWPFSKAPLWEDLFFGA